LSVREEVGGRRGHGKTRMVEEKKKNLGGDFQRQRPGGESESDVEASKRLRVKENQDAGGVEFQRTAKKVRDWEL